MAETLADEEHAEQALRVLASKYRSAPDTGTRRRVLRRWPAVHVMSTVSVAAEHYAGGNLWPQLSQRVGARGQTFQKEWGEAFVENLGELGLPDFADIDDPGLRYLGPILMHSGMPTYCLRDYYRLINERRRSVPGLEPETLVAWAAGRAVEGRLYNVDKPVERFLRYGGEYAVDVTDRVFELLETVATGAPADSIALPSRFREVATQMREQRALDDVPARRRMDRSDSAEQPPRLKLDPYGRGPLLWLPPVDTSGGGEATWALTIGASTERFRTQSLWPGEPASEMEVSIVAPARSASVALVGYERLQTAVPIVDDKDPLLAFSEEGNLLPAGLPLRGSAAWLLYPGGEDDLVVQGALRVVAEGLLPPGWAGWTLRLVDLSQVASLRSAKCERSRRVRAVASARIVTGDPIPALKTRAGAPVFAEPPRILLPGGFTTETEWTATVLDGEGSSLVAGHRVLVGDHPAAIWDHVPRPLLGRYSVRVRGPWGRGSAREVFLAEGVDTRVSPPWRRINDRGLVAASVEIYGAGGLRVEPSAVRLDGDETEARVVARTGKTVLPLTVRPPHMSMSYQSAEWSTAPSTHAIRLYAEDLREAAGTLTLDLQESAEPVLHVLDGPTEIQRLVPTSGVQAGIYRFDLRQLGDTLAMHPRLRLALDEDGALAAAIVTPRRLFSSMHIVDGVLHLEGSPAVAGLTAVAYLTRAPWRAGYVLPVVDGVALLPDELRGAGPLLVSVRIDDPWLPAPVPRWPTRRSVHVDQPGWYCRTDEEAALSKYLAGESGFPNGDVELAWLWAVAARLPALQLDFRFLDVADACSAVLREDPPASMRALELASIEQELLPEVLVRSGLLAMPTALADARTYVAWTQASVLPAALLTAPHLVAQVGQESPELADARMVCGDLVEDLLRGIDPDAVAGRFDQSADAYSHLDPATRGEFRRAASLVPRGLLHKDSRVQAALALLDEHKRAPAWLSQSAGESLRNLRGLLHVTGDAAGMSAVRARMHPMSSRGWRTYPALSIGWAWIARRAARGGKPQAAWIHSQRRLWAELARIAPDLVSIDIMLAELLISSTPSPVTRSSSDRES